VRAPSSGTGVVPLVTPLGPALAPALTRTPFSWPMDVHCMSSFTKSGLCTMPRILFPAVCVHHTCVCEWNCIQTVSFCVSLRHSVSFCVILCHSVSFCVSLCDLSVLTQPWRPASVMQQLQRVEIVRHVRRNLEDATNDHDTDTDDTDLLYYSSSDTVYGMGGLGARSFLRNTRQVKLSKALRTNTSKETEQWRALHKDLERAIRMYLADYPAGLTRLDLLPEFDTRQLRFAVKLVIQTSPGAGVRVGEGVVHTETIRCSPDSYGSPSGCVWSFCVILCHSVSFCVILCHSVFLTTIVCNTLPCHACAGVHQISMGPHG
jgi:hypothetical protein